MLWYIGDIDDRLVGGGLLHYRQTLNLPDDIIAAFPVLTSRGLPSTTTTTTTSLTPLPSLPLHSVTSLLSSSTSLIVTGRLFLLVPLTAVLLA